MGHFKNLIYKDINIESIDYFITAVFTKVGVIKHGNELMAHLR